MSAGTPLDASALLATVRETLEGPEPARIEVRLGGAASALGPIVLVGGRGRLVAVSVDRPAGPSALAGLLLAESGAPSVGASERPSAPPSAFPEVEASLARAAEEADRIRNLLDPHGGLEHRPRALRRPAGELPPAVARLVELADGQRALAELLARSELDGVKTAAALARLGDEGWLSAPTPDAAVEDAWGAPEAWPPPPTKAPAADAWPPTTASAWPPVGAVAAAWPPSSVGAPTAPPILAPTAPPSPAVTAPPVVAPTAPPSPAPPSPPRTAPPTPSVEAAPPVTPATSPERAPAPRRDEFADDRLFADAGVQDRRPLAVVAAVALAVLLFVLWPRDSGEPEPRPAPTPKPAPIARVATVTPTVAAAPPTPPPEPSPPAEPSPPKRARRATPAAYSFANPPPVVGPGGDPEVLEAQRMLDAGDLAAASEALATLRRKRARDPAVWVLSGLVAEARGDLDEAYAHATRAVKVDRKAYRGWVLKGSLEQFQRKPTEAVDSYKKALTSDPDHPMSSELRGVVRRLERDEG